MAASSTQATVINFDTLASNVVITNQYPEATFTSTAGSQYRTLAFPVASAPNCIAGYSTGGALDGTLDLFVTFTSPVNGLTFNTVGDDSTALATADIFVNNVLSSTVSLTGDGNGNTADLQNLSSFNNITSIHIRNVTDPAGIGYDDFTFTQAQGQVPEPSTWATLAFGTGIGALALRRRRVC